MSVRGVGIDVAAIDRFERILERHGGRFVDRICRPGEMRQRHPRGRAQHLAGLFAAKEAVLKALGTGWDQGLGFRDVEVTREAGGRPAILLHGAAARRARELGTLRVHVSITHDRGIAAAVAVLEGEAGA
ncbi:MAG: holo-ACP synthase [Acidobacteriota bacterium]|nr:holo-ACP synthase [Acidobacteriota bacterium]MDH3524874.1 holo-ACP synthase [Acidobacteriota bacterium]